MSKKADEVREHRQSEATLLGKVKMSASNLADVDYEGGPDDLHNEGSFSALPDSGQFVAQSQVFGPSGDTLEGTFGDSDPTGRLCHSSEKGLGGSSEVGLGFGQLGHRLLQKLLEVVSLRSKPTGGGRVLTIFPLPTSRSTLEKLLP